MKRYKKIALLLFLLLVVFFNLLYFIANSSRVQTFIAHKATQVLSSALGTEVYIEKAELRFFRKIVLHNVLVRDMDRDTLLYTKELNATINFINPIKNRYHLSELHLDQLKINFNKKSGEAEYNYAFLNLLGGNDKEKKGEIPDFKLGLLSIKLLEFEDYNADKRQRTSFSSKYTSIKSDKFDLQNKLIHFNALVLEDAFFQLQKFGLVDTAQSDLSIPVSSHWNPDNWDIKIGHTMLSNSKFQYQKTGYLFEGKGIDYNDIFVQNINLDLLNTHLDCDSIKSKIENLSAEEKSGFKLHQLQGLAKIAPDEITLNELNLITPNSNINHYYAMKYGNINDFKDYVNKVKMEGHFKNAKISFKDINYFAKALDEIEHNTIYVDGKITGPINRLRGKNLDIQFANNGRFEGDVSLTGLPNFQETFIHLDISRSSGNYADVFGYYPHLPSTFSSLSNLGRMYFKGKFIGFPNDFVAEGNLVSEIGSIDSDINVKMEENDKNSSYSGKLSATDFNLGKWLQRPDELGLLSFNAEVKGNGLKLDNMDAQLTGVIHELGMLGYNYSDINVDGSLQKRLFEGKLTSKDPNLNLEFDGLINFMEATPELSFQASLKKADLKALKITEENYTVSTDLRMDIIGDDIDNFSGTGSMFNNLIVTASDTFRLDSLNILAKKLDEQSRYIGINSELFDANFNGYFSFRELPKALQDFANFYIVQFNKSEEAESYIKQSEQLFTFDIHVKDSENFTQLLLPGLKNIQNAKLNGSFSSFSNTLILSSQIEKIKFFKTDLHNLNLRTTSSGNKFQVRSSIDSVMVSDSLISEAIVFNSDFKEDSINFHLGIQDKRDPNHLILNGQFQSDLESIKGGFVNSELVLINEVWALNEPNVIEFSNEFLFIKNLMLSNKDHLLKIETEITEDSLTNMNIALEKFPLNEISNVLKNITHFDINGIADGSLKVQDLFNQRRLQSSLNIYGLKIDQFPMGDLNSRLAFGHNSDLLNIEASLKGPGNDIILSGTYDFGPSADKLNLIFRVRQLNLENASPFLQNIVTRPTGNLSGNVFVYGPPAKPILSGKLKGSNISAKVNYLNTRYTIANLTADLMEDRINFGSFEVLDEDNNKADGRGKVRHDYLKDFFLDFSVTTERFKFLNTKSTQNQSFYGTAYGKGFVAIAGDLNNIDFYINATTLKDSDLSVSVSESKDVEQYSFYRFVNSKEETEANKKKNFVVKRSPISVKMDLNITELTNLNLILDFEEGDVIKGNGAGKLKIELDNYNDLSIAGKYEIYEGDYMFSLQNIISKKFKMEKGSSITWLGDPTDARLDIKAVYKLRTSPYDLIEDAVVANGELESAARSRVPTYLYLLIGGTLDNPRINFDIKVPDADQAIKSTLDSKLQLVKLDANELNKQVVALLVLNRFVPVYPLGSNNNNTVLEGVNNTVSEFISNQLSLYLSDWISKFITEVQLDINFRNYQAELGETGGTGIPEDEDFQNRRELQLALTKSFLNNRLIIDIGGNFDFGQENQESTAQNNDATNVTGDFEIQYGITKDNRLRLKAFRKSEYDIFNERNRNKTGLGVLYQREFDNFKDLIKFRRNKNKDKSEEAKEETPPELEEEKE